MSNVKCSAGYLVTLLCCVIAACVATHKLPKIQTVTEDFYPPAARRLGEEGRVLIEFHLDGHRRPTGPQLRQSDGNRRLDEGALRLIRQLMFDPSYRTTLSPKTTYRVTVIFCLQPGNCDRILPFPHTEPVTVKATPMPSLYITPVSAQ